MAYDIRWIHYRDLYDNLIWSSRMRFRRLHGPGEEVYHNSIWYKVRRVAISDETQHVNLEVTPKPSPLGDSIKDSPEETDDEVIHSESGFSEDGGPDWPLRDSPKNPDIEPEAAPSTCQLDTEHP